MTNYKQKIPCQKSFKSFCHQEVIFCWACTLTAEDKRSTADKKRKEAVEEKMRTRFNFVIWVTGVRHLSHRCVWLVKVHLSGKLVSSKWNLYPPQSNSRWALSRDGPRLSATMAISYFKTLPPALCCQRAPGVPVKFTPGEQVKINKSPTDQERE